MAIYRPASRRPLLLVAGAALVGGLVAGFFAGQATAPGAAAVLDGLRDRVGNVTSALEVLRVEYAEAATSGADPGAAEQAVTRAQEAYEPLEPDLALIDADAADQAYRALQELGRLVGARAPVEEVESGIDAVLAALDSILATGGAT